MNLTPQQSEFFKKATTQSTTPIGREIIEYPFWNDRLQSVDYESIIAKGAPWTDPIFKPDRSSLFDKILKRNSGMDAWDSYEWKRPSEVYGEGNFKIFSEITPADIK